MTEERRKRIERLAEKFTLLAEEDKTFIAGYMAGKEEERAKWEARIADEEKRRSA